MHRRSLVQLLAAAPWLGMATLPGCGFALRSTPALPFQKIALTGFAPRSLLADELRRALSGQVQVQEAVAGADLVLHAETDRRERSVVAATATAQTRELQLRLRFDYRLKRPGGQPLAPLTEMLLSRDMSTSETFALAKAQEEAQLFAAMQTDVVQQVLRRLSRVNLTAPADTAAAAASAASR